MKKLFFFAAFAALLLSCGPKQLEMGDVVFDYPGIYKVSNFDEDGDLVTATVDDDIKTSMDYVFLEVMKEDSESLAEADPAILNAYLAGRAYEIYDIFLPDEKFQLTKGVEGEYEVEVNDVPGKDYPEASISIRGVYYDETMFGFVYSTILDGRYRVSAYGQASSEDYLDTLEDIFRSARIKE